MTLNKSPHPKKPKKLTRERMQLWMYIGVKLGLLLMFVAYIFGGSIENYHEWYLAILAFIVIGVLIGMITFFVFCRIFPKAKEFNKRNSQAGFQSLFIIVSILLSVIIVLKGNESVNVSQKLPDFKIQDVSISNVGRGHYWIFIEGVNGRERLGFGKGVAEKYQYANTIPLNINTGLFGLRYYSLSRTGND